MKKKKPADRHLDVPAEANRDKHINFIALENRDPDPAIERARGNLFQRKQKVETNDRLTLSYFFPVRSELIFTAWTKPELMRLWLFKSPDNEIISIKTDLQVGGRFSILELNKTKKIDHFGNYLEIDNPHKLVFTLAVPWHFSGISKVAVEITDKQNSCAMIFTQSGIDTSLTKNSWEKMFKNLNTVIEK